MHTIRIYAVEWKDGVFRSFGCVAEFPASKEAIKHHSEVMPEGRNFLWLH